MLINIFLLRRKNLQNFNGLEIFNYPEDLIKINNKDQIQKIINVHSQNNFKPQSQKGKSLSTKEQIESNNSNRFLIDTPVPQIISNLNIFTISINGNDIIGLIFEEDDNPYDYKQIFEELINELIINEKRFSFLDEIDIENFLITMFIDIRRFGDDRVEKYFKTNFQEQKESFFKIFLFGIDNVGKSSLVRRIVTGQFNDNYFIPTRKFNIDYFQDDRGVLVFWDMPGQRLFREKWLKGFQESNIIIFMIDISNQLRFEESKAEFWKIINRYELFKIPLLILGNKYDLIDHSDRNENDQIIRLRKEIFNHFNLKKIEKRKWKFLFTSIKTNLNINEAIDAIYDLI